MDYTDIKDRIVLATLPNVPFDGWSWKAMRAAAEGEGLDADAAERAFPGGPVEAVLHFIDLANRTMEAEMAERDTSALRLVDRVRMALRLRLERWTHDREAVRRGMALLALSGRPLAATKATYKTVDSIWHAAGDRSVDFSFYTKRAELAAIYTATLLVWLDDTSEDSEATWAFLDRRLEGVIRVRKARAKLEERLSGFSIANPLKGMRKPSFNIPRSMRMR